MHCYEYELMHLVLEDAIRAIDPMAEVGRLELSDILCALAVDSLSDLRALTPDEMEIVARRHGARRSLAA